MVSSNAEKAWMPSTEQVRSHYVFDQSNRWDRERGEAFDRWLAEHDREVAARTLEAFDADLHEWYPEDVFPKPSAEGYRHLHEELTHADLTLDVFSADLMRRAGHLARDRAAALRSGTEGSGQ